MTTRLPDVTEYDQLLCPLPGHSHDEDRLLFLMRETEFPIYLTSTDEEMAGEGVTSGWRVSCIGGHRLAVSQGEEGAESVPMPWLLETLSSLAEARCAPQPCGDGEVSPA